MDLFTQVQRANQRAVEAAQAERATREAHLACIEKLRIANYELRRLRAELNAQRLERNQIERDFDELRVGGL